MELLQQKHDIEPGVSGRGTMNVDETKRSVSVSKSSRTSEVAFKLRAGTSKLPVLSASATKSDGNQPEQFTSPSSSPKDHPASDRPNQRTICPLWRLRYSRSCSRPSNELLSNLAPSVWHMCGILEIVSCRFVPPQRGAWGWRHT